MSNRLFQSIIRQTSEAIGRTIGVVDDSCVIVACSDSSRIGETIIRPEAFLSTDVFTTGTATYKPFGNPACPEFAVFIVGTDEFCKKDVVILSVAMNSVKQQYDDKYDKVNFIKNVLLDNILPGDVYIKARELRFNTDVNRVCMIVKITSKSDISPYEVLQSLFPDKSKDFVINVNETDIALVKEINKNIDFLIEVITLLICGKCSVRWTRFFQ